MCWRRGCAAMARRRELTRLLWEVADLGVQRRHLDRSAASFDNADWVEVVIHSYRHRYNLAAGDPTYADFEARLFAHPDIGVPSIILTGQDGTLDGGIPPDTSKFTAPVDKKRVPGGHNLIQ